MPVFLRVVSGLLALAVGTFACAAEVKRNLDGTAIDQVWSGHPVGFALVVEQGHVYVGYYDAERHLTVASRAPGGSEWTRVRLEGVWVPARQRSSNVTEWDSHNSIVMMADRDGHLHLSANMHVDPLVYYRTTRPLDVTSFQRLDRMTGEREARCTYPHFFKDAAGELYFSYRDGTSGDGADLYNRYDPATQTWRRHIPTALYDGEGLRSAYGTFPRLGPDRRFHVLWMWRDTPDAATNQKLGYARSADLLRWEDAKGNPVELPITYGEGDLIDDAKPGEGLINTTYALGFDHAGKPVAVYHRYDAAGNSQLYAARPQAEGWQQQQITDWTFRWAFGGGGSLHTEVFVSSPRADERGSLLVPFRARAFPNGVLRLDATTLRRAEVLPQEQGPLSGEQMRPRLPVPGMEVRTHSVETADAVYTLRWETLPENRDKPRAEVPAPSELRLFETPKHAATIH